MRKNCAEFWTSGAGGDRRCYLKVRHMHLNQSILNWQIMGKKKLINQSQAIHAVTKGFARDVSRVSAPKDRQVPNSKCLNLLLTLMATATPLDLVSSILFSSIVLYLPLV